MTGYVYAIQPEGMSLLKIGATTNPKQRATMLSAFTPMRLRFVRLIRVASKNHALIWEQQVLARTMKYASHGEWRFDKPEVHNALSSIDGVEDECPGWFEQTTTQRNELSPDALAFRLELASAVTPERDLNALCNAIRLPMNWHQTASKSATAREKYRRRLHEFLRTA